MHNKSLVQRIDCCNIPGFDDHELVVRCQDHESGLRAFIAIHNTNLGSALGGCRMWNYESERDALTDVLKLASGMSYKHAIARTKYGGGKAVIFGNLQTDKNEALFRAFGKAVDELAGKYITAEDVGTAVEDMVVVAEQTRHVAGLPIEQGGSGDPSPVTAYGVYCSIVAAIAHKEGRDYNPLASLAGKTVAVQGLGHVGMYLCRYLSKAGASLIVTDLCQENVDRACREFNAVATSIEAIYDADADIFAPCALGGILDHNTIERFKFSIIAGAANNQLASPDVAAALHSHNILYCVDYVVNAGGIINVAFENQTYDKVKALSLTESIGATLLEILQKSVASGQTTLEVANAIAQQRLAACPKTHSPFPS